MTLICLHTAHTDYELQGEVPKTIMIEQTVDISNICEYDWYEWVMLRDNTTSYPDDKQTLGRYLGPATDVGSTMCYKILKADGQIACCTTFRYLTFSDRADLEHENLRIYFDTHITDRMGAAPTMGDFDTSDLTLDYVYYEDPDTAIHEGYPYEILPTPESGDNYVNVEIMLPRGYEMAMGQVTKRARDSNSNPLGTDDTNPILDTRQYIVEFDDGYEAELAANVIATNMYAQCDPNRNQYVLLDSIIDFC